MIKYQRVNDMNFFITLNESFIPPLIKQLEQYIYNNDSNDDEKIYEEDISSLEVVLDTLYNIQVDLESPLSNDDLDFMKTRFKEKGGEK